MAKVIALNAWPIRVYNEPDIWLRQDTSGLVSRLAPLAPQPAVSHPGQGPACNTQGTNVALTKRKVTLWN